MFIVHYHNRAGFAGKLLGEITFTDGVTLKVWDADVHQDCIELAAERVTPVRYTTHTSPKWGNSLRAIARTKPYEQSYDDARARDEQIGRLKPNSFAGHQLSKDVQTQVDAEKGK